MKMYEYEKNTTSSEDDFMKKLQNPLFIIFSPHRLYTHR